MLWRDAKAGFGMKRSSSRESFHQLDAVAEGIGDIEAVIPFQRLALDRRMACLFETGAKPGQILDQKSGMRLSRGTKVLLDAKMHPYIVRLEPASAPRGKGGWLRHFPHGEERAIEIPRAVFPPAGMASWM